MSKNKNPLYNQLLVIKNTEENRNKVKHLNKRMKEYGSRWRLSTRYRKPKEGHKYGYGGSLACDKADGLGIYVKPCQEAKELEYESIHEINKNHNQDISWRDKKIERYSKFINTISDQIMPDEDWCGSECPVCKSSDIDCYDDYVDSERWSCNGCKMDWSCNKDQRRYDLTLDID